MLLGICWNGISHSAVAYREMSTVIVAKNNNQSSGRSGSKMRLPTAHPDLGVPRLNGDKTLKKSCLTRISALPDLTLL